MHKLTSSDLDEVEGRLRTLRVGVLDNVRARLAADADGQARSLGSLPGAGDQAVEDMLMQNDIALLAHERDELAAIDAALRRIEFGVGGICTVCGAPIAIERLRAVPTAATCVPCATGRER